MTPRSASANEQMRERSREQIMAAAMDLFAERGFAQATISQITSRAGVSRGLVSYYFPTKRALLEEILLRWLGSINALLATPVKGDGDAQLGALIDLYLRGVHSSIQVQPLLLGLMLQPSTRDIMADLEAANPDAVEALENRIRAIFVARGAADPVVEEIYFRSLLEGVTFKLAVYGRTYPLEAVRRRVHASYGLPAPTSVLFTDPEGEPRLRTPRD